jgi:amino acid transporter
MSSDTGKTASETGGSAEGQGATISDDVKTLHSLGYAQELLRRMSGFSNFAISFSIICILAGGLTSFQLGFSSVGGAAIGIGWPLCCLITLVMALAMAQVASAFPTAGGLYHWSSILGGKGWGWATAWINLIGLVTVLAAINVGTYLFVGGSILPLFGVTLSKLDPQTATIYQLVGVGVITFSQALFNHLGIRLTTRLTDLSGYLIMGVTIVLAIAMIASASHLDFSRLTTFTNYSGDKGGGVWPETGSMTWLFLLGFLLPAYTITGYDASAHTSEETIGAAKSVPRGILQAVIVSAVFGWILLSSFVLAMPDMDTAAGKGADVFFWLMDSAISPKLRIVLYAGIIVSQYLCGLATVTSSSRMMYAFARDGGLPFSSKLKRVSHKHRTPVTAIWTASVLTWLFTAYAQLYAVITAVCVIFLYVSYAMPTIVSIVAYGRSWSKMGPFDLGAWYRPVAAVSVLSVALVVVISVMTLNRPALWFTALAPVVALVVWFALERRRFQGPPQGVMIQTLQKKIAEAERAVGETTAAPSGDN